MACSQRATARCVVPTPGGPRKRMFAASLMKEGGQVADLPLVDGGLEAEVKLLKRAMKRQMRESRPGTQVALAPCPRLGAEASRPGSRRTSPARRRRLGPILFAISAKHTLILSRQFVGPRDAGQGLGTGDSEPIRRVRNLLGSMRRLPNPRADTECRRAEGFPSTSERLVRNRLESLFRRESRAE